MKFIRPEERQMEFFNSNPDWHTRKYAKYILFLLEKCTCWSGAHSKICMQRHKSMARTATSKTTFENYSKRIQGNLSQSHIFKPRIYDKKTLWIGRPFLYHSTKEEGEPSLRFWVSIKDFLKPQLVKATRSGLHNCSMAVKYSVSIPDSSLLLSHGYRYFCSTVLVALCILYVHITSIHNSERQTEKGQSVS